MSLTYRRNRRGPSTVPWGTPDSTGIHDDWAPFSTTRWLRSERNDEIHALVLKRIPRWSSFNSNQQCGTESKAFEKSKIAMSVRKPYLEIWPNHWLQEPAVFQINNLTENRVDVEWEFGYRPGSCWRWNTQRARVILNRLKSERQVYSFLLNLSDPSCAMQRCWLNANPVVLPQMTATGWK